MRVIDWQRILSEHRIPFITSGANVGRGELAIQCPFCGSADPSKHMGLNLETGWWSCWRNRSMHSGKSPVRLLMRLLGVPYGQAREIAGLGDDYVDPEGFDALAARLLRGGQEARPEQVERRFLDLPRECKPITDDMRTRRAWNYLYHDRGFDGASAAGADVDLLCELYHLHYARIGEWKERIIIPYYMHGDLVTWSGRAIGQSTMRYKDLSVDESLVRPKATLFNHDCMIYGGKVLVIVEGAFDAMKLDFYGRPYGVRAVGLSTNSIQEEQVYVLQEATGKFKKYLFMLDNSTRLGIIDSMRIKRELAFMPNLGITPVPVNAKDAGALHPDQVITWCRSLVNQL